MTAADRPYGEFYGFYSVSPENFGSTHVHKCINFFFVALLPNTGHGLLILEISRSHTVGRTPPDE